MFIKEALSDFGIEDAKIKWPNDVMVDDKKIAGVLLETRSEGGVLTNAIIGFGINVNMEEVPEEIEDTATSMYLVTKSKIDRAMLLTNILFYFENLLNILVNEGRDKIFEIWRKYNNTLGRKVEIHSNGKVLKGIAKDIDKSGFLLVDVDGEVKKVVTADSVRFL